MADYTLSAKITGDASDFKNALSDAQKSIRAFKANMESIGDGFSSMGKNFKSLGSGLSKYITKPALLATTALGGLTLGKGWSRMKQIDDARVKLEAIGNSAEDVEEIMNNATASVKGTAYGLDEAATTAASAVAAGIPLGYKLEKYLTNVADAAAVANVDMSEMGTIFNKVATQGKASNEILQQLAERGIPIYQYLAEVTGKSADEIFEMAKDGKVSLEMFQEAVEKNIGGAAKTIGSKTITGAISNLSASVSRIGANFLGSSTDAKSFAGAILPMLNDITSYLVKLEDKAKEWGATFGEVFNAIYGYCKTGQINFSELSATSGVIVSNLMPIADRVKELTSAFMNLSPTLRKTLVGGAAAAGSLVSIFGEACTVLGNIYKFTWKTADGFGKLAGNVPGLGKAFEGIKKSADSFNIGTFGKMKDALLKPFVDIANKIPAIGNGISSAWNATGAKLLGETKNYLGFINNGFGTLTSVISDKLSPILSAVKSWGGSLTQAFSPFFAKIASFAPAFAAGMNITAGIGVLVAGLGLLYGNFRGEIDTLLFTAREKGPQLITNFCDGIAGRIPDLITMGGNLILNLLNTITANLPSIIEGGVKIITSLITGTAQQLPRLIPAAVEMIMTLVQGLLDNLPVIIDAGIQLLTGLAGGLTEAIPILTDKIPAIITSLVTTFISKLPELIATGIKILIALGVGLIQAIPQLIDKIPEIINAIKGAFTNVDWLGLGSGIIESIASGVRSFGPALLNAMEAASRTAVNGLISVVNWGISQANKVPGINIPSIPYLLHGTDNWQGGFAYMNEGGRGELVNLPNGSQVIPHDISVKYAKEAARTTSSVEPLDVDGILDGVIIQVINSTSVDGTPLKETVSDYTIRKINNQQRAVSRARGVYA